MPAGLCDDVEFSPEDAGRSDPEFLTVVLGEVIKAGATTLNIPDTVGYTTPEEFGQLIAVPHRAHARAPSSVIWSVHCHNDLGLATANTLAGIQAGARQVEVTINGIGERAGNTSLEEVVMALHTRPQVFGLHTDIDTTQITRTSRMVSAYTGMVVQPNKAIVGANAFAHEAGIHQDGMLKSSLTYEIMRPETVGLTASKLVLGKHSGRHAFRTRLNDLGYGDLSRQGREPGFRALQAPVRQEEGRHRCRHRSDHRRRDLPAARGLAPEPHPGVLRRPQHPDRHGQPDAARTARCTRTRPWAPGRSTPSTRPSTGWSGVANTLTEFSIKAVTEGIDAVGEVTIRIQPHNGDRDEVFNPQTGQSFARTFSGHGADTDIIVASAHAPT